MVGGWCGVGGRGVWGGWEGYEVLLGLWVLMDWGVVLVGCDCRVGRGRIVRQGDAQDAGLMD